jgi:hypothetical protein
MNNKIATLSAVLMATSMSMAITTWNGANSEYRVETGFDDGSDTYGYWYSYNDNEETKDDGPGSSKVEWAATPGTEYGGENALDPVIDACGGLCGTATMGGPYKYPFVGIGFNVGGEDKDKGFDISSWGGICIGYKSTGIAPALEIAPADEEGTTGYNNFKAKLKITEDVIVEDYDWPSFKQEAGWGTKVEQETVLKNVNAIKFKLADKDGKSTEFNITKIGAYGKCGESGAAIGAVKAASAVKATLSGRTLSFVGAVASAEVINLQGQVVKTGSTSAAMDLSALESGVYMVRVAGKTFGYSLKILLK